MRTCRLNPTIDLIWFSGQSRSTFQLPFETTYATAARNRADQLDRVKRHPPRLNNLRRVSVTPRYELSGTIAELRLWARNYTRRISIAQLLSTRCFSLSHLNPRGSIVSKSLTAIFSTGDNPLSTRTTCLPVYKLYLLLRNELFRTIVCYKRKCRYKCYFWQLRIIVLRIMCIVHISL